MIYALQIMTGKEEATLKALERSGFSVYLPRESRLERRGGIWIEHLKVIMPGYLFISLPEKIEPPEHLEIIHTSGVIRVLGNPEPQPLTSSEKHWIQWLCNDGKPLKPGKIEVGTNITVISGPLRGLETKIVKVHRRQRRVDIILNMLGQEHKITLSADIIQV